MFCNRTLKGYKLLQELNEEFEKERWQEEHKEHMRRQTVAFEEANRKADEANRLAEKANKIAVGANERSTWTMLVSIIGAALSSGLISSALYFWFSRP